MINDVPDKFLVEKVSELPNLKGAKVLYIDFETTSGEDKKNSKNPWMDCDVLGICITVDEDPAAYYVPLRHRNSEMNLPTEPVYKWLREIVRSGKVWVNSNTKYDAHVYLNYVGEEGETLNHLELRDTVVLGKIYYSDDFTYGLKQQSLKILREDISGFEDSNKVYTHNVGGTIKIHDYAVIPPYEMYLYGTQDVITARKLYKELMLRIPEDCLPIVEIENRLTGVLLEIERNGLKVDVPKLYKDYKSKIPYIMQELEDKLYELTGKYFRPHVNEDCYDILCTQYGIPVLNYTKGSKDSPPKPSFDKDTLKIYETYAEIPKGVVHYIILYRHYHQLFSNFTKVYLFKNRKQIMHPDFNQVVRTGRMSCRDPNMQQSSPAAKEYVIPREGFSFIEFDLSQIEYRYVATYTENPQILEQYRINKDADYHQIMADLCGIDRAPAKNMNFASSFRAGKKKVIAMLRAAFNPAEVPEEMSFDSYCLMKGEEIFETYHMRHKELKIEWTRAERICKRRGYCRNTWGRRRHLTNKGAYMAFPNIIQSSAADLMKRITIRLQNLVRDKEPRLICIVHDSWLFEIPKGGEDHWEKVIKDEIEGTESRLAVPLYASADRSDTNWKECK